MSPKEEALYEPIKNALWEAFIHLGDCHLEVTYRGLSNQLQRCLDDFALFYIKIDKQIPDITGFVKTTYGKEIVTVEVKSRIRKINDFFQAKRYAEVFDAKYAFLVSSETIPEQIRRFIKKRSTIYSFSYNKRVIIAQFDETIQEFKIDKELYYGSLPEPFKTAYKPTVYFFDPNASKENIIGRRVIVKAKKAYHMGGWVDDLVREGKVAYSLEKLEAAGITYEDWLLKHGFREILRPPTKEELDP